MKPRFVHRVLPVLIGLLLMALGVIFTAIGIVGVSVEAAVTGTERAVDQTSSAMDHDYNVQYRFVVAGKTYTGSYRLRHVFDVTKLPAKGTPVSIRYLPGYPAFNARPGVAWWAPLIGFVGLLMFSAGVKPRRQPPAPPAGEAPNKPVLTPAHKGAQGADGERIVGIVPGMRRKTGWFSSTSYNLVVTDRRILFATLTKQMLNQAAKEAAAEGKAQGKGFFGRAAIMLASSRRVYEKYWQMAPEAILAETPGNFALNRPDVASIRIVPGAYHGHQQQQSPDRMVVKTQQGKMKLVFDQQGAAEAKALLEGWMG